jgi:putative PIN family toxin of toxin-antitoxin system
VRIVIDTNIWISGLLWKGDPWRLLTLAEQGEVELCMAFPMVLELEEVLHYERFQPRLAMLNQTPERLAAFALSLATALDVSLVGPPIVEDDPDDDIFLHCAERGQANYIVTADKHLLKLQSYRGIPIVSVEEFFRREFVNRT